MRDPRDRSILARLFALLLALSLVAAACGGDDEEEDAAGEDDTEEPAEDGEGEEGGEIIDLGTFVGDPPEHLDPALNSTLDAYQVINALYDGLTDIDASDPDNPKIVPLVAESYEANDDATVWTFVIRDDVTFSDGEQVLPSSFVRAWERASDPDFAGDYSYLFNFIEGGEAKLAGEADTLAGVKADDEEMTLEVTLSEPYSNFDAVAGFQLFFPMPSAVDDLTDQNEWENGVMIGNGPFKMEKPRTEQEIVLVRNDDWAGDFRNERAKLDKITFRTSTDPDTAYNSFEAGEGDIGQVPPGRVEEADENYGTTLDVSILGSYHFLFKWDGEILGGDDNKLLRQAISQAINREEINEAVYDGSRTLSTGIVPEGIPGFEEGICEYCSYDEEAAQAAFDEWTEGGGKLSGPLPIQFNADAGHEDVVQIMIDNLKTIGIDAVAEPMPSETYFSQMAEGACKALCRAGWFADYPTYDNFMYDLFHGDAIGGNNYAHFDNEEFNSLVDEAKQTVAKEEQGELFRQAEQILLNDEIAAMPVNWYRGDYVYNEDKLQNFNQSNFGLIEWEAITVSE